MSVETGSKPVKDGFSLGIVVSALQDDGGDPGGGEDGANDGECNHAAVLDVQALTVPEKAERFVVEQITAKLALHFGTSTFWIFFMEF